MPTTDSEPRHTHNPYLRDTWSELDRPDPPEQMDIDRPLAGYLGMGGRVSVNPISQWDSLASVPPAEAIERSRLVMGRLKKAGRQALAFSLKDRRGVEKPEFSEAVDELFYQSGWMEPEMWGTLEGQEGEVIYDEVDPEYTLASALVVMSTALGVLDTYSGLKMEKKKGKHKGSPPQQSSELKNFSQATTHMLDQKAYEVMRTMGPRALDAADLLTRRSLDALDQYAKNVPAPTGEDEVDIAKWYGGQWTKAAMCLISAGSFLQSLAETKKDAGDLSTEELRKFADELMAEAKANQEYGVQDAVGPVENKNLPFAEVHIAGMDSVIRIAKAEDSFKERGYAALMTFTNGHFLDSSTRRAEFGSTAEDEGLITLTQNIQEVKPPHKPVHLAVFLGMDGELYNTHGYALRQEAEAVDADHEYETLRVEAVSKFFDLTVPLDVDPIAEHGRGGVTDQTHGQSASAAEWSSLRVRRERPIVPASSHETSAEADAEKGNAYLALHNIPWQFRRLPKGFRRTEVAVTKYHKALSDAGIDPQSAREIPDGYTFVKAYSYGNPELGEVRKRLEPKSAR